MKRPHIICHMMSSVDGRIDCAMTSKLRGVDEYYQTLSALGASAHVSGRTTAELEMADAGSFAAEDPTPLGREGFSKKADSACYDVVVDTRGTLLWNGRKNTSLVIVTSEAVSHEYLDYLDGLGISWIACGAGKIDLARASQILAEEFGVKRMAIVGGPTINAGFLAAGLLDEVSLLMGPGIDGRSGMPGVFDGLPMDAEPAQLKLTHVESYGDGAVWLRYDVGR